MLDFTLIAAFFIGLLILCLVTKILSLPVRLLCKMIYNSIIGAICLWGVNILLGILGLAAIPIKFVTALIAGIFGIPGVLLVTVYYLLK
ncbi:pro-sigmaK processing inhibitor BofA family protein [Pectinatus frisingensis]|nr:pro-sigmaK processing inhibitor BofA family protein [Pectinatus frisingensis]